MAEQGIADPYEARRKALRHQPRPAEHDLPDASEITAALHDHLALFQRTEHPQLLRRLRERALQVMTLCAPFRPHLVGAVLDGSAVANSPITIHLLGASVEEVTIHLMDRGVGFRLHEVPANYGPGRTLRITAVRLLLEESAADLVVFDAEAPRQAPRCTISGRTMVRADRRAVSDLLSVEEGGGADHRADSA
jgi:hypothetical protein